MENKLSTKVIDVTPVMAQRWLNENNTHNRPLYPTTIDAYALDMKRGVWALNHQGICFDEEGTLMDGQHRLAAVVESGKTVPFLIIRNMPKEYKVNDNGESFYWPTQMTVDMLKKRSNGDQLNLAFGLDNANLKAAMIAVLVNICTGKSFRLSVPMIKEVYDIYKTEIEATVSNRSTVPMLVCAPALGSMAFAARPFKQQIMEFEKGYFTGANLPVNSPILRYRNYMLNRNKNYSGILPSTKRGIISHGLNCMMHHVLNTENGLKKLVTTNQGIEFFINKQKRTVNEICEMFKL